LSADRHVDQPAGVWQVEDRLGDKAARQGCVIGRRTPDTPLPAWQEHLYRRQAEHADVLAVLRAQRAVNRMVEAGQNSP